METTNRSNGINGGVLSIDQFCKTYEHVFKVVGELGLGAIGTIFAVLWKEVKALLISMAGLVKRVSLWHPKISLVQDPMDKESTYWQHAKEGNKTKINIHGKYHMTLHGWDYSPAFVKAIFEPTGEDGRVFIDHFHDLDGMVTVPGDRRYLADDVIINLTIDFWIAPGIQQDGQPLKGKILLVDQYGKKHSLGVQTFKQV